MKNGGVSWKEELREVIQEAVGKCKTADEFKEYLDSCYGVKITQDGKDYSYLHPQKKKPIRGEKLGTNYTKKEILRKLGEQTNRQKSAAHSGRNGNYRGQSAGTRIVRTGTATHGASAGSLIAASLDSIEREMQRLNFEANCASRGTDAASVEREMEQQRAREESERRHREYAERAEREQQQPVGSVEEVNTPDDGNSNSNTGRSKYSYGKGD